MKYKIKVRRVMTRLIEEQGYMEVEADTEEEAVDKAKNLALDLRELDRSNIRSAIPLRVKKSWAVKVEPADFNGFCEVVGKRFKDEAERRSRLTPEPSSPPSS